ncbi:glycoside hydrolase [Mucilaginibacter pedocola]|uniref:Glycoside hydrolase n=1 Tax=Mucilaginibacter pedocola TaxID=1792845 RepID=A0A1S9PE29_9SPHI|nr:glycoside hydrolase [Mucilaginibacter pedocola]OOQ59214.1 glycoside hydrolase [Mucilaginibacter pedocola]
MKRKITITALLSLCFMVAFAAFADLNGKWAGTLSTPDGQALDVSYNFKVDGEKVTGTATSPMGEVSVDDGKIKGDAFTFKVNVSGNDYPHSGKVYADSVAMDVDFGGASSHFVLKRAK